MTLLTGMWVRAMLYPYFTDQLYLTQTGFLTNFPQCGLADIFTGIETSGRDLCACFGEISMIKDEYLKDGFDAPKNIDRNALTRFQYNSSMRMPKKRNCVSRENRTTNLVRDREIYDL